MSALDALTEKQRLFVVEYAADMDRLRAAKEAGYKGNLSVAAAKLLANPKVQAALAEVGTKLDDALMNVENLVKQLARFLYRDVVEFVDDDNYLRVPLNKLPYDIRQCIEGWDVERTTVIDKDTGEEEVTEKIKVRFVPKAKAIELAMKWRQMLGGDTTNVNIQNNMNFDWSKFYENPPNVVEERMKEALGEE